MMAGASRGPGLLGGFLAYEVLGLDKNLSGTLKQGV